MVELVTGATGFIGSHLIGTLLKKNRKVRALVRKDLTLKHRNLEIFRGDLLDFDSLKKATKGITIVYNTAGMLGGDVSFSELFSANVTTTENLIKASISNGVKRFIHLSSVAAMGKAREKANEKEECMPITDYDKVKDEAEAVLQKYTNQIEIIILRPTMVYGPGEIRNKSKLFQLIQKGYFRIIGNGENQMSLLYIDNLIDAILLSALKGKCGETYIISDEKPYTMNEFTYAIAKELKIKNPNHIPIPLAKSAALFFTFASIVNIKPLLTFDRIDNLTSDHSFDISKAKKELGYRPKIGLAEGIKRTVKWYKKKGILS